MLVLASASPRRRELLTQAGFSFEVHPAHIPEDPYPNEDPIAYVIRLAREKAQAVFRELTSASPAANVLPPVKGTGFSPDVQSAKERGASQASEKLPPVKGTGFSPCINAMESTGALAPEGGFTEISPASANPAAPQAPSQPGRLTVLGADTTVTLDNHILGKPSDPADAARMLRLLSGRTHRVITGIAVVTAQSTEVAAEVTAVKFLTLSDEEIAAYVATGEPMDKAGAYAIQGRAARWIPRIEGDYFNVVGLPIALVSPLLESR